MITVCISGWNRPTVHVLHQWYQILSLPSTTNTEMSATPRWGFCSSAAHPLRVSAFYGVGATTCARRRDRGIVRASAADEAQQRIDREVGTGPDVAFGGIAPVARGLATVAAVLGAGAVAFVATPKRIAPFAAGASSVAVVAVGAATLRRGPEKAARRALAKSVAAKGDVRAAVDAIPRSFGIKPDTFAGMKQSMYETYLGAIIDTPGVSYGEVAELTMLKYSLQLDGPAIGDAHFEAARAFYRNNVLYLDADVGDPDRETSQAKLDKLIFLSDRMYADKDTDEAYVYERSRLCNFFALSKDQYDQRFADVALPFYSDVIDRATSDSSVSKEDILAAQAALGVKDYAAEVVRGDAYSSTVESLVQKKGKLETSDTEKLARLRSLFEIDADRATSTLKSLAEPVYRQAISSALDSIGKNEESYASVYGKLALRQTELGLPADSARATLAKEVTVRADDIVKKASKYLRVQNLKGCVTVVKELLDFSDKVVSLVHASEVNGKEDTVTLQEYMEGVGHGLSKTEPTQMYRIFLSSCLADRKIDESEEVELRRLRAILNLDNIDAQNAFKAAAGPVYRKLLVDALAANKLDDETKANIESVREDLALPLDTAKIFSIDLYKDKLRNATEGNRILQENEAQQLFALREFMSLSQEDTAAVHKTVMSPIYEQSVNEAMGPTGILLDDYRAGLERLRDRLCLTKDDADAVFYRVIKGRMKMYVSRAMNQLEKRSQFRGQSEGRDVGEDPNIKRAGATLGIDAGGLPIELSSLVDFYVRNKLVKEEEIEVEGEKRKVTKYPITLRGEIEPKVYNELYKQYVVQCFSASSRSEKQRLFAALDQLGSILGMTEEEVSTIHANIGSLIYKNYISQALIKGPLETKDVEFLQNIEKMLSMKRDQCEKIEKDAKESRVSVLMEQIFNQPKVLPESIKKARETAKLLEVDIVKDLAITEEQRGRLFGVEIDAAIDRGELTAENQSIVQEAQTGLQVSDEKAKSVLLGCIQRRSLTHLVQAAASLRQDRSETAVSELRIMLRYGKLLPSKVTAPAVSLNEKQELFLLFQAFVITDGAMTDTAKEQIELLKTMFGFSDADLGATV